MTNPVDQELFPITYPTDPVLPHWAIAFAAFLITFFAAQLARAFL